VLFEDAHWADPTTLETLDAIIDAIALAPILLVITFRPDLTPPWVGRNYVTLHNIGRLDRRLAASMVMQVTGGKQLPRNVIDEIVTKTDGVPLFVEELTKTVLESGIVEEKANEFVSTGALSRLAIPSTLRDSLMARLDRLGRTKEVAQIGACIGREFSYDLLALLSPLNDEKLSDALGQLVEAELIISDGDPPDDSYLFKHALIRDTAYESLLKSRRIQLHSAVADELINRFPDIATSEPETIAQHLTKAGRSIEAITYWESAGNLASRHSSNVEAVAHLQTALSLVPVLPAESNPAEHEMRLLNVLAAPLMNTKGYAAPETGKVYERITELCETTGEGEHIFQALSGASQYHMVVGDSIRALKMAEDMLERAEREKRDDAILEAHRLIGLFAFSSGQFPLSVRHLDIVRDLFDATERENLALTYGQDHEMSSYIMQSIALAGLGYLDRARANVDAGVKAAFKTNHVYSQAYALAVPLLTFDFMRDVDRIDTIAKKTVAFCSDHNIAYYFALASTIQGYAMTRRGELDSGILQMRQGIEDYSRSGAGMVVPHFKTLLSEALIARGDLVDAEALLDEADEPWDRWGEGLYRAETIRVRGDLYRRLGEEGKGEACYCEAIEFARRQEAKLFELRASVSLARHLQERGEAHAPHDLLASIYGWFTEGLDAADLQEARALLEGPK